MRLFELIIAFDDAALEVLANKGMLRRAHKGFKAGNVAIETFTDECAKVAAADHIVSIPNKGPSHADCDCPATGVCWHIVLATIALRETGRTSGAVAGDGPKDDDALASLQNLAVDVLVKFAGADWPAANIVANNGLNYTTQNGGGNCNITFSQPEAAVTFVSGSSLKDALYKGPKTRKRLLVTAAALAVRDQAGIVREAARETDTPSAFSASDLTEINNALMQALVQVNKGAALLASERLFDLAISTRIQKAPRLTGQLLSLSKQAVWANDEHISYDAAEFISLVSGTYALVEAMKNNPADTKLIGSPRREYQESDPLKLLFLGVDKWNTTSGARGISCYGYDVSNDVFYTAVMARAGGMDPNFTPETAYQTPIWNLGSVENMTGNEVHFDTPFISLDNQLSASKDMNATMPNNVPAVRAHEKIALCFDDWASFHHSLATRVETGLRRSAQSVPSLIQASSASKVRFDELSQTYHWDVRDKHDEPLMLSIAPELGPKLKSVAMHPVDKMTMLVLSDHGIFGLHHRLMTVILQDKIDDQYLNLAFDEVPHVKKPNKLWALLKRETRQETRLENDQDGLATFACNVLYVLSDVAGGFGGDKITVLSKQAEARGLITLSNSLAKIEGGTDIRQIICAAYICSEILALGS